MAVDRWRNSVLLFDAAGLAFFAVAGTQKALTFGLNPVMAALLGMVTGIGGGMVRDVLVAEIPTVLRADLYAVAALAGAAVVVAGSLLDLPSTATTIAGVALCFGLRLMAIRRGWQLPIARPRKHVEKEPRQWGDHLDAHPDERLALHDQPQSFIKMGSRKRNSLSFQCMISVNSDQEDAAGAVLPLRWRQNWVPRHRFECEKQRASNRSRV
jgi:Glycine transporter